jgi:hypothetical protein
MISHYNTTDATTTYREYSALNTVRLDRSGDTGSLISLMRDTVLVLGPVMSSGVEGKVPEQPNGSVDAISR